MKSSLLRLVFTFATAFAVVAAVLPMSASAAQPEGFVATVTRGSDNSATFSYNPIGVTGAEWALSNTSDNWSTTGFANPTIGVIVVPAGHNFNKAVLYLTFSDGSRVMFEAETGSYGTYAMVPGGPPVVSPQVTVHITSDGVCREFTGTMEELSSDPYFLFYYNSDTGEYVRTPGVADGPCPGSGGENPTIPDGWERTTPEMSVVFCVNGETVRTDLWGMEEYGVQPVLGPDGYAYIPWPDLAPEITRGECGGGEEPVVAVQVAQVNFTCEDLTFVINNPDASWNMQNLTVHLFSESEDVFVGYGVELVPGQTEEYSVRAAAGEEWVESTDWPEGPVSAFIYFTPKGDKVESEAIDCSVAVTPPGDGGDSGNGDGTDPGDGSGTDSGNGGDTGSDGADSDSGDGTSGDGSEVDLAPAAPTAAETSAADPVNGMPNTGSWPVASQSMFFAAVGGTLLLAVTSVGIRRFGNF